MRARSELAGAGRATKRGASKAVRQSDRGAIRQGLMEMETAARLEAQENFAQAVEELSVPPELVEGEDPLPAGHFRLLWPAPGALSNGS